MSRLFKILLPISLLAASPIAWAQTVIRVHCGGSAYTDSFNQTWNADAGFYGGSEYSLAVPIANTNDQGLYQSERYDSSRYSFDVPAGNYIVTLKFAEIIWALPGQRVFDVAINGATVLSNFDIVAQAGGPNIALDESFNVSANTGNISIDFLPGAADLPKISAIQIVGTSPASFTPESSLDAETSDLSFGAVNLDGSGTHGVTFTNHGNSNVTVSNVSILGGSYGVSGVPTGLTLNPGQSVMLNVTFVPGAIGDLTGSVTVYSDAVNSPATVSLSGMGVHSAVVTWTPSASVVTGYNTYQSAVPGGPYVKLNSSLIQSNSYLDTTIQAGQARYYVVTAVDTDGVESPFSDEVNGTILLP